MMMMLAKIMALRCTRVNRSLDIGLWVIDRVLPAKRVAATSVLLLLLLLDAIVKRHLLFIKFQRNFLLLLTQQLLHTGHESSGAGCISLLSCSGCIYRLDIAGGEFHQELATTRLDGHRNANSLEDQSTSIEFHQQSGGK